MNYADYEYYKNNFLGNLESNDFKRMYVTASQIIDNNVNQELTDDVITNLKDREKDKLSYTTCALIDLLFKKEQSNNLKVTSYSIDGVSKTFNRISDTEYKEQKREILNHLPDRLTCYV